MLGVRKWAFLVLAATGLTMGFGGLGRAESGERIECPEGYWQSNSTTVAFCVNKEHSTYKDTPICFLTDTCKYVEYRDIKSSLIKNEEPLKRNWFYYIQAKGSGGGVWGAGNIGIERINSDGLLLTEVWPGLRNRYSSWGKIAKIACEGGGCQELVGDLGRKWQLSRASDFVVSFLDFLSWNGLVEVGYRLRVEALMGSNMPISLEQVPAKWVANAPIYKVVNDLDLWSETIDQGGYSQPTAGQGGMLYLQLLIAQRGGGSNLQGLQNFTYDSRNPADKTNPGENKAGQKEPILTGSNRFVKSQCQVQSAAGQGYNNCAHVKVRLNKSFTPGNQLYILVSGEKDILSGKGGGDIIVFNTPYGQIDAGMIHNGDFRGIEHVGATNDEPLLPQGGSKEMGLPLDQCEIVEPTWAPLTRNRVEIYQSDINAGKIFPAYRNPCPNRYRKQAHTKTLLRMDAGYNYLVKIKRICTPRQVYRLTEEFLPIKAGKKVTGYSLAAWPDSQPVYACESIKEFKPEESKKIDPNAPIPWPIRGGLLEKQK